MVNEQIVFRQADYSDKYRILKLFKVAFAHSNVTEKAPNFWDWQMLNNPDGEPFIGLAEIGKIIVGHYAVIPYEYYTEDGTIIKIGLVIDVMVHPNFQKRGIFVSLSKYSLPDAVKKLNLKFTIGYPFTGTTYSSVVPGHLRVGWRMMDKLNFYMLPINLQKVILYKFPFLKSISKTIALPAKILFMLRNKIKLSKLKPNRMIIKKLYKFSVQQNADFNDSDLLLYKKYSQGKFIKKRDMKFLNWRFCKRPDTQYSIIRIINSRKETIALEIIRIAYLRYLKIGVIIDIFSPQEFLFDLMNFGISYLKKFECDAIVFIDYNNSKLSKIGAKLGFIDTKERYQIINWKYENETIQFPKYPRLNFVDFDIF